MGKEENAGNWEFLLFPNVFYFSIIKFQVLSLTVLSSAKFFKLDWSKTLSFGTDLMLLCDALYQVIGPSANIDLTLSQTSPGFSTSFENTVGKGEIAGNKQFLLFPSCFLPF